MNPLNQFKIHDVIKINLGIWNFSLTNAACTLILGYVVTLITSKIVTAKLNTVPGKDK